MAKTVRVPLSSPIVGHKETFSSVELREPKAAEYWENGEPARWAHTQDGVAYKVENDAAIKAYIEACVVSPGDVLLLGQLSLADAMLVKEAVLGFFTAARTKNSTTSSNSSS
jgi:hypothetical protein